MESRKIKTEFGKKSNGIWKKIKQILQGHVQFIHLFTFLLLFMLIHISWTSMKYTRLFMKGGFEWLVSDVIIQFFY